MAESGRASCSVPEEPAAVMEALRAFRNVVIKARRRKKVNLDSRRVYPAVHSVRRSALPFQQGARQRVDAG